jgi:DedD protein
LEQRVKERLTGAVILVAVVVLLVPELFRGDRDRQAATRAADPSAPPVQSYTIELGGMPVPAPSAPPVTAALPLPVAVVVAPVAQPTPATVSPPTAKPAAPKPQLVARASAPGANGWVVQVGSFSKRENASRMVQDGARRGVKLAIAGPDDRGLYRVRSAVQPTRAVAVQLQSQLREKGYKGLIATAP